MKQQTWILQPGYGMLFSNDGGWPRARQDSGDWGGIRLHGRRSEEGDGDVVDDGIGSPTNTARRDAEHRRPFVFSGMFECHHIRMP